MTIDRTKEAFFTVCDEAEAAARFAVSLYIHTRPYGGPEEGGWWRDNHTLVAYQVCETYEEAAQKKAALESLSKELTEAAKRDHSEQCSREMEWLEARGLDADHLPEVDGGTSYWATVENRPGEKSYIDSSHYE